LEKNVTVDTTPSNSVSRSELNARHSQLNSTFLKRVKAWIVTHTIPEAFLYPFWQWYAGERIGAAERGGAKPQIIPVQDAVWIEVYWTERPPNGEVGPGPRASVMVLGDEILRLDCFGGQQGHYHINPRQGMLTERTPARLCFPEGSHADNVERTAFEVEYNLPAALLLNRIRAIREIKIDDEKLSRAAAQMRAAMLQHLAEHEEQLARLA